MPRQIVQVYRQGIPAGVFTLATAVYGKADTVTLALLLSPVIAGVYGSYYRVVIAAVGMATWISPLAAGRFRRPTEVWGNSMELLKRLSWVAAVLAVLLLLTGPQITKAITHGGVLPGPCTFFLSMLVIPTILSTPLAYALLMIRAEWALSKLSLIVMAVAVCVYPSAIALGGVSAVAAASLAVHLLAFLTVWWALRTRANLDGSIPVRT
jgi:O-antigen/teichoic acid export membrane protein